MICTLIVKLYMLYISNFKLYDLSKTFILRFEDLNFEGWINSSKK